MKHLIAVITGVFLTALVAVSYADQTIHRGEAGKNVGTSGNDIFALGNVKRAGARPNNGTVTVHARGGSDTVYADYRLVRRWQHTPEQWGAWGCGEVKVCYRHETIRQGVVAFMGAGNDTFVGSEHGDIAFTGSGNDRLLGLGGDDVLIANGAGESAELDGGDGDDLLWNRRSTGTVRYDTDRDPDRGMDTIIAGAGADLIRYPHSGITIIGFDPENDYAASSRFGGDRVRRFGSLSLRVYRTGGLYVNDWKNSLTESENEMLAISNQEISLPNINLLGHSFTLSEDAVDMGKATVFRTEETTDLADIYSSVVTFIPLKGQEAITEVLDYDIFYADNPRLDPNYRSE